MKDIQRGIVGGVPPSTTTQQAGKMIELIDQ
jgi:hypothetical protein